MIRRQPRSTRTDTLFPYTTLFRTAGGEACGFEVRPVVGQRQQLFPRALPLPCRAAPGREVGFELGLKFAQRVRSLGERRCRLRFGRGYARLLPTTGEDRQSY